MVTDALEKLLIHFNNLKSSVDDELNEIKQKGIVEEKMMEVRRLLQKRREYREIVEGLGKRDFSSAIRYLEERKASYERMRRGPSSKGEESAELRALFTEIIEHTDELLKLVDLARSN